MMPFSPQPRVIFVSKSTPMYGEKNKFSFRKFENLKKQNSKTNEKSEKMWLFFHRDFLFATKKRVFTLWEKKQKSSLKNECEKDRKI